MSRKESRDLAVSAPKNIKLSASSKTFYVICYVIVALVALVCLIPFILLISGSFTSEQWIRFHGFSLWPGELSLEAYKIIFKTPEKIVRAYGVSIFITAVGTLAGLFLTSLTAYVISRKDAKYRNALSFFFYFTTLFNGGMVSTYIFYIQYLHLKDNYLALILPGVFNVFYLLIMRTFVNNIPFALIESAKLDGAGEWRIYFTIILPLLKSGLATIGLFLALGYTVSPEPEEYRGDIIQTIQLRDEPSLIAFCRGMQKGAPVDSFVVPEPSEQPGYTSKVIMAAGALSPPIASSTTVVISDMIFPPVSTGNILLNITGKINTYIYNMTINATVISPILISIEMELIVLESS